MDSDYEILPEARIFDTRIDNICKENMEAYNKFNFHDDYEEDVNDIEEEIEEVKPKTKRKRGLKKDKIPIVSIDEDDEDSVLSSRAKELLREIAAKKQARYKGRNRGNKRKTANSCETGDIFENIKLTASAKRRIREVELETARDSQRIEEENKMIFAKCDNIRSLDPYVSKVVEDINREISIKIRYQFKISKVKAREKEEFKSIFQKVADMYGMKPTNFLLCLGDNNIKLNDTPESLNIRICDIIDCIPYDQEEETINNSHKLLLKIQSNDTRKKIEFRAHKLEKFLEVMKRYADLRKLPLESLTFEFDGELIQPDETPSDLDMESGSCIDVRVSNTSKPLPHSSGAKNIPPIPMMNIVVLD